MKATTISKGGQLSIPAEVRHRWATRHVAIEDHGSRVVIRPIPDDPIGAAIGSLKGGLSTTNRSRALLRAEERVADDDERGRS